MLGGVLMPNLYDMFRVGKVSSVNYEAGAVRVTFEDKDDMVSDELPMIAHEYEMPAVGDEVLCLFFGNSISAGICFSRYFFDGFPPVEFGPNIWFKHFLKSCLDAYMKYDSDAKTFILKSLNIALDGSVTITGNLQVNGNIHADGSIIDVGGNTNHHLHE
jgi:phage baseplate assembly protein gpV